MFSALGKSLACAVLGVSSVASALYLDPNNPQSVRDVAAQIAGDLIRGHYDPAAEGVGLLGNGYYWWESGAMFGGLVDYWAVTGDTSLNGLIGDAILSQASSTLDFMMPNQKFDLGNDDQCLWALTAMSAAEHDFPLPGDTTEPSSIWYTLAKNAFNDMFGRWDTSTCNGGIRWQIYTTNAGYNYKSSIANGGNFQLAARLYRYTGDVTYLNAATQIYNWMAGTGIVIADGSLGLLVFDGASTTNNCSTPDQHRWTYSAASMLYGAAILAGTVEDKTLSSEWAGRMNSFLEGILKSFVGQNKAAPAVIFEMICEPYKDCNTDEQSFKAYLARWMGRTTLEYNAPLSNAAIKDVLTESALAAATNCAGGSTGTQCGTIWYTKGYDGETGVGQELAALEVVQSLLVTEAPLNTLSKRTIKTRAEYEHPHVKRALQEARAQMKARSNIRSRRT